MARGPAGQERQPQPPREFVLAISMDIPFQQRVATLERLVRQKPDSPWADDALWALGQLSMNAGRYLRALYYWQLLMAQHPDFQLEEATRRSRLYANSSIARMRLILTLEGLSYLPGTRVEGEAGEYYVDMQRFNCAPMAVLADMALLYQRVGRPALAAKAYERALALAPEGSIWARNFRAALRRMRSESSVSDNGADLSNGPERRGQEPAGTAERSGSGGTGERLEHSPRPAEQAYSAVRNGRSEG